MSFRYAVITRNHIGSKKCKQDSSERSRPRKMSATVAAYPLRVRSFGLTNNAYWTTRKSLKAKAFRTVLCCSSARFLRQNRQNPCTFQTSIAMLVWKYALFTCLNRAKTVKKSRFCPIAQQSCANKSQWRLIQQTLHNSNAPHERLIRAERFSVKISINQIAKLQFIFEFHIMNCSGESWLARAVNATISPQANA